MQILFTLDSNFVGTIRDFVNVGFSFVSVLLVPFSPLLTPFVKVGEGAGRFSDILLNVLLVQNPFGEGAIRLTPPDGKPTPVFVGGVSRADYYRGFLSDSEKWLLVYRLYVMTAVMCVSMIVVAKVFLGGK